MADPDRGEVAETYVAALQHDLVAVEGDADLVGVVREPTGREEAGGCREHTG